MDMVDYAPLLNYEVWTEDFEDLSWMVAYSDFVGNSSIDDNSNWLLIDDEDKDDRLS